VTDTQISEHRENCNSLADCYCTSVNTTRRTASLIQSFMEHAEHTQTFFYLIPLLCRFRIVTRNRQEALHSALFNYTPLVVSGDRQKYTVNEQKQTGIYRKKYVNGSVKKKFDGTSKK
jgi:hypothetical protein